MNRWVCLRCYTSNEDSAAACAKCGLLRGSMAPAETASASPIAPPRSSPWGGLLRRFGWVAVVGVFAIGGAIFAAQRDDSGAITQGGSLPISDLRVGDCFDPQDIDAQEADEVNAKRCDEGHQFEMISIGNMPDGGYPSDADFEGYVADVCLPAFDDYIGLPYESSRLDIYWYVPVEEGWNQGDHEVQCAVYDPLDSQLIGSLRDAVR
ncbi:MAG TPA: septum formation family protein [Dehalococcoidia bacterium]|nr:septum formation family protein [Dehalococcoidia bacterium]